MIELQHGMKVHAKKVDLQVGNTVLTYSAPRGKKFALVLMGAEDPTLEDQISVDKWLRDMGWDLVEDNK